MIDLSNEALDALVERKRVQAWPHESPSANAITALRAENTALRQQLAAAETAALERAAKVADRHADARYDSPSFPDGDFSLAAAAADDIRQEIRALITPEGASALEAERADAAMGIASLLGVRVTGRDQSTGKPLFWGDDDGDCLSIKDAVLSALEAVKAEARRDAVKVSHDAADEFDRADWFWRVMDPDDCGDSPEEAINRAMVGRFCVCQIASSFIGPVRYGFVAPVIDPDSDDEEFVHFATHDEAVEAARIRAALAEKGGA